MAAAKADDGVSVAVAPETLMDAETPEDEPLGVSEKVDDENDELLIARENVTLMLVLVEMPLAPDAGARLVMVGGVAAAAVVKLQLLSLPKATPLVSVTLPETVAV